MGSCKFLVNRFFPLLKEIVKRGTKQFLSVYMIPQITIKNFKFFLAKYKNDSKEHKF